jgi:membrane-associated phospholipid phosphatase
MKHRTVLSSLCWPMGALLSASTAFAQVGPAAPAPLRFTIDQPSQLPELFVGDFKAALNAPSAWDARTWEKGALGVVGLVGISMAFDRPVDHAVRKMDRSSLDPWGKRLDVAGGLGTVLVVGGAYVGGWAFDQPKLRGFGADAAMSMLVAQLLVTIPGKFAAGRSRPFQDQGPFHFKPFHGGASFPSGHSTQAFSLATVLSEYGDSPWVSVGAYAFASLVALSRIEQRAHHVSDVVAGAAIGTLTARMVTWRHQMLRQSSGTPIKMAFAPVFSEGYQGVRVSMQF